MKPIWAGAIGAAAGLDESLLNPLKPVKKNLARPLRMLFL
jgi:hypothetical protein